LTSYEQRLVRTIVAQSLAQQAGVAGELHFVTGLAGDKISSTLWPSSILTKTGHFGGPLCNEYLAKLNKTFPSYLN
jgi:hypothetical protein